MSTTPTPPTPPSTSTAGALNQAPTPQQATQLLSQIPFGSILGGPLTAAVDAQKAAAQACAEFIQNVGFDKDNLVRTVTFKFERSAAGAPAAAAAPSTGTAGAAPPPSTPFTVTITVPLLTIVVIPFIRIESLTVAFKTNITASTVTEQSTTSSSTKEGKLDGSVGFGPFKVGFSGGISSKKDSTATSTSKYSVEHTIDINLHATQDDMPAGLAKLLGLLTDSIGSIKPSPTALPS